MSPMIASALGRVKFIFIKTIVVFIGHILVVVKIEKSIDRPIVIDDICFVQYLFA